RHTPQTPQRNVRPGGRRREEDGRREPEDRRERAAVRGRESATRAGRVVPGCGCGVAMAEKSYRDAIRDAMMEEMDRDQNVLIMGEDIGVYEGTFRITAGMLKKYGPKRVIDTPIAEAGMAGTAVGMAMVGVRPIVEMM